MGRKIPAKKHRGVKDPLVQQARRLLSLKGKINAPPKDPDEQPVPRSLTALFAFQNKVDEGRTKKRNNKNKPLKGGVAQLKQLPGESGRDFSLRISSAVSTLRHRNAAYPEDAEPADVTGERMAALRQRRRRGRAPAPAASSRADSRSARALRERAKRTKAAEEAEWSRRTEARYERVRFGDVAHAPPALLPGARRGLLLAPLLAGASGARGLAEGERERARLAAVAAYRAVNRERRAGGAPKYTALQ